MSRDRDFLEDIVVAARLAQSYAAGLTRDELSQNIEKQDSIVRRLAVIGEASTKVPPDVKADLAGIPWASIVGLRNIPRSSVLGARPRRALDHHPPGPP
jgi:uncharacterized protein with HEPN domain